MTARRGGRRHRALAGADRRPRASTATTSSPCRARCPPPASPSRPTSISCASSTLLEAVASSLTELFAPKIHKERISGMLENYDFIGDEVMPYFKRRLTRPRATPTSRSTTSSATPARREEQAAVRRRACASSATCCGRSSTRCTTPMSTRADPARRLPSGGSAEWLKRIAPAGRLIVECQRDAAASAALS